MMCRSSVVLPLAGSLVSLSILPAIANAQLSKVDRLLQQNGLQLQAAVDPGGAFYYDTHNGVKGFTQTNYTAPSWAGSARFTDNSGTSIPGPWAIWNVNDGTLPHEVPADAAHLPDLVSMAIGDEQNWESDPAIQANLVATFQAVQANPSYSNTVVYTNNFIGQTQLNGTNVSNFIQQAHPDMLTFDGYPYNTGNASAPDDSVILNTPFDSWYTEMRFYRDVTLNNSYQPSNPNYSVAWGAYRQIYATSGDGTRRPSATEYAVQTNTALAFNAKYLSDFIYNDSATQLFASPEQTATTPFYDTVAAVNQRAKNLGRTLVNLTPLISNPNLDWAAGTPDILMLRGQQVTGNPASPTTPNTLPNGFQPSSSPNFSSWTQGANDPWCTGFGQANIGNTVNQYVNSSGATKYAAGDALISWFRPAGETRDEATTKGDLYFMIVNALSTPTATPEQGLQNIHMDFSSWPLAPGQTLPSIQYMDPVTGQIITLSEDQTGMKITNATIDPAGTVFLTNTLGDSTNQTGKLRLSVFLDGGDAFLFKFNTGSPFLVPEPGSAALAALALLAASRRRCQRG